MKALWLLGIWFLIQASAGAEVLKIEQFPKTAPNMQGFIPEGWKMESQLQGDLNQDQQVDLVLTLVENKPAETPEGIPNERLRALVILFKSAKELTLGAMAPRLLYCTTCGGMLGGKAELTLQKGVLVVNQLSGSREALKRIQRFRYDAKKQGVILIGEDLDRYDRATGDNTVISSNYLTGLQITQKYRYSAKKEKTILVTTKKKKIPKQQILIDAIDYANRR